MKATCQHVEHFRFVSRERRRGHSHTRREEEEVLPVNLRFSAVSHHQSDRASTPQALN